MGGKIKVFKRIPAKKSETMFLYELVFPSLGKKVEGAYALSSPEEVKAKVREISSGIEVDVEEVAKMLSTLMEEIVLQKKPRRQ